jgi:subtilase family serine protease
MVWANQATAQTCGAVGDQVAIIGTLAAGASKTVTVTGLTAPATATGTLRSFVDSSCATAESNETNNQLATSYTISQPDFTVTTVTVTPTSPVINTAFSVAVTVKNSGTVSGDGGQLRLWLNQATAQTCAATGGDKTVAVGTIAAGASKTLTFSGLTLTTVATRTLQVLVDATCAKVETNETNNRLTKSYRVTGPRQADLLITAINLTPATPAVNSIFSAAVTVKNQGNNPVAGAYLDLWANQTTAQTCGTEGNAWVDMGGVAAGASKTVTVNGIPAGVAGSKTLRAFVDSWCETVESNETNNQLTKSYTVQ